MSEPHCNNTCKHRQCITQVMRSSTLLTLKDPLSNRGRQTNTFLNAHTLAATLTTFPYIFLPPFPSSPLLPSVTLDRLFVCKSVVLKTPMLNMRTHSCTQRKPCRGSEPPCCGEQHSSRAIVAGRENLPCPFFFNYCVYSATGPTGSLLSFSD